MFVSSAGFRRLYFLSGDANTKTRQNIEMNVNWKSLYQLKI